MNICIFARAVMSHGIGGMQRHTKLLSEKLVNLGNKVVIITTSHPQKIPKQIQNGVEIHYLENVISSRYTRAWWRKSKEKFIDLHKKIEFDIIYSESSAGYSYIKYKLRRKFKIPFIIRVHGTTLSEIKSILFPKLSLKKIPIILFHIYNYLTVSLITILFSDIIITVSRELKKAIPKEFLINEKRVIYKPNGIDSKIFCPISINEKDVNKVILSAGKITKVKGFQNIISILPDIINEIKNIKLFIIGTGPYIENLRKLCHNLNLINYVDFLGKVTDDKLIYYYNLSDIFISASLRIEGLPYVILEAMACETTIITSKIGGIPTAIKHLSNGILVPPGDMNSLKNSILFLLKNEKLARKLAENARKDFLRRFDLNDLVLFHNNLFLNLCKILKNFY